MGMFEVGHAYGRNVLRDADSGSTSYEIRMPPSEVQYTILITVYTPKKDCPSKPRKTVNVGEM